MQRVRSLISVLRVRPLRERLWDHVDGPWVDGVEWDDCWLFNGSWRSKYGYGRIRAGRRGEGSLQAHIVAFELVFGKLAPSDYASHACGVALCCNPFHIAPSTQAENCHDRWDGISPWYRTPLAGLPRWLSPETA